jgi:ubiquinone/menaquinone biosynthesis C-methylase UbiE
MTDNQWKMFFEIHEGLPREGPGGDESTRIAWSCIRNVPQKPRILDIGCGPGAQTVCLADISKGEVHAIDNNAAFIGQLKKTMTDRGLESVIHPLIADMAKLEFENESFDMIWAEGSIFIIGVERGLREWRRFLKDGGTLAFTEACWLEDERPAELDHFWQEEYPDIRSIEETLERIERLGYRSIGHFVLPEKDWWDDYYNPILKKLPVLFEKHKADDQALEVLKMTEMEIDMYRRYSSYYGYVFYIAEKHGPPVI